MSTNLGNYLTIAWRFGYGPRKVKHPRRFDLVNNLGDLLELHDRDGAQTWRHVNVAGDSIFGDSPERLADFLSRINQINQVVNNTAGTKAKTPLTGKYR